jgi:hypothetical protein
MSREIASSSGPARHAGSPTVTDQRFDTAR